MKRNYLFTLLSIILLAVGCSPSEVIEDIIDPVVDPIDESSSVVNEWAYDVMTEVYLWNSQIPDMDMMMAADSYDFFDEMLYYKDDLEYDKWSWIVEDYDQLVKDLNGQSASFGYEIALYLAAAGSSEVIAIVEYVDANTPASKSNKISRGDIFVAINGTTITVDNYMELLFNTTTQTITFGEYSDGVITETGEIVTLTAEEFQKDPIHINKTFSLGSDEQNVGYLCYTSFLSSFDQELNDVVIPEFKSAGVKDLILDLRYNSGGSVLSAENICAMLLGSSDIGEVLTKKEWNSLYQEYFENKALTDPSYESYIESVVESDLITYTDDGSTVRTQLNQLDLTNLYVLATSSTASASELVINSLKPYMNVIVIGENTTGKFVASSTFNDTDEIPAHNWAIQPIIYQSTNSNDDKDYYWVGFTPDYLVDDQYTQPLGTEEDDMVRTALEIIEYGSPQVTLKSSTEKSISMGDLVGTSSLLKSENRSMYDPRKFDLTVE